MKWQDILVIRSNFSNGDAFDKDVRYIKSWIYMYI